MYTFFKDFFLVMKRKNNMGSFLFRKKANKFQNIAAHILDSYFKEADLLHELHIFKCVSD